MRLPNYPRGATLRQNPPPMCTPTDQCQALSPRVFDLGGAHVRGNGGGMPFCREVGGVSVSGGVGQNGHGARTLCAAIGAPA